MYTDAVTDARDADSPTAARDDGGGNKIIDDEEKLGLGATSHADVRV